MKWSFARLQLQEAEVTEASESLNTHLGYLMSLGYSGTIVSNHPVKQEEEVIRPS